MSTRTTPAPRPTIADFTKTLSEETRWYTFGIFMGVPPNQLDEIGSSYKAEGVMRCLIEIYKCIEQRGLPMSWELIAESLSYMENYSLAKRIQSDYNLPPFQSSAMSGQTSSSFMKSASSASSHDVRRRHSSHDDRSVDRVEITAEVADEFKSLSQKFSVLAAEVKSAFKQANVDVERMQDLIVEEYGPLKSLPPRVTKIEDVWENVQQNYSILNFEILAFLTRALLGDQNPRLQTLIEDYSREVDQFKLSAEMSDLAELIKAKQITGSKNKVVKLKLREFWSDFTIKKFEIVMKETLKTLYRVASQISVEKGCIYVSWVIPNIDTAKLLSREPLNPELLRTIGVLSLHIGDEPVCILPEYGCDTLEAAMIQAVELKNIRAIVLLEAMGCDLELVTKYQALKRKLNQEELVSGKSHWQERKELKHLNDRFVNYISHVRMMRQEKERLDSTFERLQASSLEETDKVKQVYDRELQDARLLIDETAKEKARFQILASKNGEKVAGLEAELKDLSVSFTRVKQELADARRHNEELDRQRLLAISEHAITQHRLQEVEKEADKLRGQIEKLQESLEQEVLAKVDLQNQIQTLKEDLVFQRKVHEEEVVSLKIYAKAHSDTTKEVEEIVEELQTAIDDAREKVEMDTKQFRQDLEKAYRDKLEMLEKQVEVDSTSISKLSAEIQHLNTTISWYKNNFPSQREDKDTLESLVREMGDDLALREERAQEITRVIEEMKAVKVNYEEKVREYEDLLDFRVLLKQEISIISSLFEEEESRMNISATPTHKKRKRIADTDEPHSKKPKEDIGSSISSTSAGFIQISNVDPEGKYVQIKNTSDEMVSIGGLRIVHEVKSTGAKMEFRFHRKSKLKGGATVTIWGYGAEGAIHDPPSDIICKTTQSWGVGPKTLTSLCTKSGEVLATFSLPKESSASRGDGSEEMDLAEGMPSHLFGLEATPTTVPTATPIRVHETDSPPTSSSHTHVQQQTTVLPHSQSDPDNSSAKESNCVIS